MKVPFLNGQIWFFGIDIWIDSTLSLEDKGRDLLKANFKTGWYQLAAKVGPCKNVHSWAKGGRRSWLVVASWLVTSHGVIWSHKKNGWKTSQHKIGNDQTQLEKAGFLRRISFKPFFNCWILFCKSCLTRESKKCKLLSICIIETKFCYLWNNKSHLMRAQCGTVMRLRTSRHIQLHRGSSPVAGCKANDIQKYTNELIQTFLLKVEQSWTLHWKCSELQCVLSPLQSAVWYKRVVYGWTSERKKG